MKAGYFSPLPPARTGVADYAAALLGELRKHGTVEVEPARCDVALYHLGNNGLHARSYRAALERPGVVVLHDAVLHHFLLGQFDEPAYIDEFVFNYGEWSRGLGRDLWKQRAASGTDPRYFAYPMLRRAAERARAVVVHNPAAAAAVRAHVPEAQVVEIPHLFSPPPQPSPAEAIRHRSSLGVPPDAFLFGVFGYLRESKRVLQILNAFARLRRENPKTALLVAGDFVSSDLERAAGPLLNMPGVVRLPYMEDSVFWKTAAAVDACINLRYPAAGETSGIAIRLMGIGKPVLVSDSAEWERLPEGAALRIPPGIAEAESLLAHMILLTSSRVAASAVGERGAAHVQAHHRLEEIGSRYWKLLCDLRC